ncbi:MAG TPA: hypothetical protein VFZ01_09455 [Geminicoccaceae bacterium]
MADVFRVALSGDFQKPDGSLAFPDFDIGPLDREPNLEWQWIPGEGTIRPRTSMASTP